MAPRRVVGSILRTPTRPGLPRKLRAVAKFRLSARGHGSKISTFRLPNRCPPVVRRRGARRQIAPFRKNRELGLRAKWGEMPARPAVGAPRQHPEAENAGCLAARPKP